MRASKLILAGTAAALASAPVIAQTSSMDRTSNESALSSALVPILVGLGLVGVTYLIAETKDDDDPISA